MCPEDTPWQCPFWTLLPSLAGMYNLNGEYNSRCTNSQWQQHIDCHPQPSCGVYNTRYPTLPYLTRNLQLATCNFASPQSNPTQPNSTSSRVLPFYSAQWAFSYFRSVSVLHKLESFCTLTLWHLRTLALPFFLLPIQWNVREKIWKIPFTKLSAIYTGVSNQTILFCCALWQLCQDIFIALQLSIWYFLLICDSYMACFVISLLRVSNFHLWFNLKGHFQCTISLINNYIALLFNLNRLNNYSDL